MWSKGYGCSSCSAPEMPWDLSKTLKVKQMQLDWCESNETDISRQGAAGTDSPAMKAPMTAFKSACFIHADCA